ncbi:carboxypeptidase-like regulatory domain-containing protein [Anthocerotibacter panamensis]|uniref:carboxypeptidase-like regulatory domain-containing protein n=1 Tax=Anthocerotibacter panamensis TaxID=2857077 RepID=UPI001C404536|nr:carboxypeptidase-like regulatory domain-containing protein [Anthocerotibacter panamensis]
MKVNSPWLRDSLVLFTCLVMGGSPVLAAPLVGSDGGTARLVGRVVNAQGNPLPGVEVQLGSLTATTDASGTYTLDKVRSAQWAVLFRHQSYEATQARVWLYDNLTTAQDVVLIPPVVPQSQTLVGLVGVGSLPKTDLLAQRLAEDMVRLKGFPLKQPLQYFDRSQLEPVAQKLKAPLAEILDRDRQNPQLVGEFFRYLGVKALVITRIDALIQPESGTTNSRLRSKSRIELWRFNGDRLQIQYLAEEGTEEKADQLLNEAEANALLQIQVTKMASTISQRWQENKNPWWQPYLGDLKPQPTPRELRTTVEIVSGP